MKTDWDLILSNKNLFHQFHQKKGIRSAIKEIMVPCHDDSFGSLTRTTDSLSFMIRPSDKRYLKEQKERLAPVADLLELSMDWDDISPTDALSILIMDAMFMTAFRFETYVSQAIWIDDPKKNTPRLRGRWLCNGLIYQILDTYKCTRPDMGCIADTLIPTMFDLIEKAERNELSVKEWGIVTDSTLVYLLKKHLDAEDGHLEMESNNFVFLPGGTFWPDAPSAIFVLPLATDDEEQGTFFHYSDMNNIMLGPDEGSYFCTDAGRYLWKLHTCKWDYELSVTSHFKVTTIPGLSARIETGLEWESLNKLLVT